MTSGDKDKERDAIRLYLLGQLSDEEQERLEERIVTDPNFQEEVVIGEEELIEDYLAEALSALDKERFTTHLLATPQQRKRLEVARALKRFCDNSPPVSVDDPVSELPDDVSVVSGTTAGSPFFRRPIVVYSLAAALLIGMCAGLWSLFNRWREPDRGQEFALLNSPQGRSRKPDLEMRLSPVSVRGGESPKDVPRAGVDIVELLLVLPPDEHQSYRVTLRGGDFTESYTISDLEATASSAGRQVPVRIQPPRLSPGDYLLELRGLTATGAVESIADYSFRVSK